MRLVLLGCPGAGKGTQAKFITDHYKIPQISTGDILRAAVSAGSALGKQVKKIMDEGQLVSDEIMIQLVKSRIEEADCINGFLLDGFPRTIPQAESLQAHQVYLDYVIEIKVPDSILIQRLTGRWTHPASGRVYHNLHNPPKETGKDDVTNEPLVQRIDDQEETIKKRLALYHQVTEPLVDYYKTAWQRKINRAPQYIEINGTETVQQVAHDIFTALSTEEKISTK